MKPWVEEHSNSEKALNSTPGRRYQIANLEASFEKVSVL
jgi:hypothetical protein